MGAPKLLDPSLRAERPCLGKRWGPRPGRCGVRRRKARIGPPRYPGSRIMNPGVIGTTQTIPKEPQAHPDEPSTHPMATDPGRSRSSPFGTNDAPVGEGEEGGEARASRPYPRRYQAVGMLPFNRPPMELTTVRPVRQGTPIPLAVPALPSRYPSIPEFALGATSRTRGY